MWRLQTDAHAMARQALCSEHRHQDELEAFCHSAILGVEGRQQPGSMSVCINKVDNIC